MFALEAQLADFRPAESVDFGVSLKIPEEKAGLMCPSVLPTCQKFDLLAAKTVPFCKTGYL